LYLTARWDGVIGTGTQKSFSRCRRIDPLTMFVQARNTDDLFINRDGLLGLFFDRSFHHVEFLFQNEALGKDNFLFDHGYD